MGALLVSGQRSAPDLHREGQPGQRPARRRDHRAPGRAGPVRLPPRPACPVQAGSGAGAAPFPGRCGGLPVLRHDPPRRAAAVPGQGRPEAAGRGIHVHGHAAGVRQPPSPPAGDRQRPHRQDGSRVTGSGLRRGRGEDRHAARELAAARPLTRAADAASPRFAGGSGGRGLHLHHGSGDVHGRGASSQGVHRGR